MKEVPCKYCDAKVKVEIKEHTIFYCWQCDARNWYNKRELRNIIIEDILKDE